MNKKFIQPNESERVLMNIQIKLMAYEETLQELLRKSGLSEMDAHLKIENKIKEATQNLFEFVEDVDPEGAAKLDQRKIEDL